MLRTHVRPSRDLRNNYAELSKLVKEHDQIIITNNGKGDAVLIGIEDYAQYEEFLHRRYIEMELAKAKQQASNPATAWITHDELWRGLETSREL